MCRQQSDEEEDEEGRRSRRVTERVAPLTCHDGGRAVLLAVAVLHADGASVGLRLVGTQPLPLLLQPVLVLQVVLHVGLGEEKRSRCLFVFSLRIFMDSVFRFFSYASSVFRKPFGPVSEVPRG